MSEAERQAQKLKRWTDIELAYTLVMVVLLLSAPAVIQAYGAWGLLLLVLFVPKFWLHGRWQRQLDQVCEVSPEARRVAERKGYR